MPLHDIIDNRSEELVDHINLSAPGRLPSLQFGGCLKTSVSGPGQAAQIGIVEPCTCGSPRGKVFGQAARGPDTRRKPGNQHHLFAQNDQGFLQQQLRQSHER